MSFSQVANLSIKDAIAILLSPCKLARLLATKTHVRVLELTSFVGINDGVFLEDAPRLSQKFH